MPRPSRKLTKEEIASVRTNPPKVMNSTQAGAYIGFSARTVGDLIRTDKTFSRLKHDNQNHEKTIQHIIL